MSVIPATDELNQFRQASAAIPEAASAIDLLEQTQDFEATIEQLFQAQAGTPQTFSTGGDRPKIWSILKTRLMQEICGDDESFRSMIKDIKKHPSNAIVVTGAITYLINLSGIPFPVEPALATGIVLYIAHIGIDVFCEWSTAG
ncbi:hypothetical protein IQ266_02675 [filamentous cyanobacterium LEGE 11480]|uniref:Uncharacterized protein n=1 Tax=Romeriopsis navalis LEGE 11480 TaxID=2777977 RepID=A0A928VJ84_9CYAN|nr:hypothetical protein [Romeriopsis navalis]MBE9028662.1 hypothetical protein [Romeriopsis navalis LEGE 11480]